MWHQQDHEMAHMPSEEQLHPDPLPVNVILEALPSWGDPVFPADGEPPPDILLGELMLMYFEWMGVFKESDASGKAVYALLKTLVPADANAGTWGTAQKLLTAIYNQTVQKVDICPNDCIAFYNAKSPGMAHYKHAHRTHCPSCGADRKITHRDGSVRSVKVGYYLPCGTWFRDLYKIEGLAPELSQDAAGRRPDGHVSKSRGWHKKVPITYNLHPIIVCTLQLMLTNWMCR
jgi:hypothetical protein